MKRHIWIVGTIASFVAGAMTALLLWGNDVDLLAESVDREVVVTKPLVLVNSAGHKISVPSGTGLFYKKKYRGVAYLRLEVITEDISVLQRSDTHGIQMYFSDQK